MTERTIVLIRHGRSAHVETRWLDRAGFLRWREEYESAGLDPSDRPPADLSALAEAGCAIVSSDAPRAIESAGLLASGREVVVSAALRELALAPPPLPRVRLPLFVWALLYGVQWCVRALLRRPQLAAGEEVRVRAAAAWLASLADTHRVVLVVTHASFRSQLARRLRADGWQCVIPRHRLAHWSRWSFRRP